MVRKLNGLIDAIAEGLRTPGLQQRLEELEVHRAELEREIASSAASPIQLHPNLAQLYRRKVEELQLALNQPDIRDEAIQALRCLLKSVSIAPIEDGFEIEIVGEIGQMIELSWGEGSTGSPILSGRMARSVKVVAGGRYPPLSNTVPLHSTSG